ncbi:MAG TPA: dynamin family protein [Blastocatellia bacterium]
MAGIAHQSGSKTALIRAVDRLSALARSRDDGDTHARLSDLRRKLYDGDLTLVVLGQFKRGKSTLINALLGAELLPTAVVPLTSVVTVTRFAPEPGVTVAFAGGNNRSIDVSRLEDYITERGNPDNRKGVARVEVGFPSQFLKRGVRLVDTPGVGSVFAANTGATYDYLPEADAAIFMLAADQPLSQAEANFLEQARQHAAKFFFVLNKIDYIDEADLKESLAFTSRALADRIGSPAVLHPVSARTALIGKLASDGDLLERSRLPHLESALNSFLSFDKQATLEAAALIRLNAMVSQTRNSIELELVALRMPLDLLTERSAAFGRAVDHIIQEKSDLRFLLRGEIAELVSSVESDLGSFVADQIEPLRRRVKDAFTQSKHLNKRKLVDTMNREMAGAIQEVFSTWRPVEEAKLTAGFESITGRFAVRANAYAADVERATAELFGVRVCPPVDVEPLTSESRHYYYTENLFSLQLSSLPLILPGPLAKACIERAFVKSCVEELYRNAGRLRYDFQERLEKSAESFRLSFEHKVREMVLTLRQALEKAAEEKRTGSARLDELIAARQADIEELLEIASLLQQARSTSGADSAAIDASFAALETQSRPG